MLFVAVVATSANTNNEFEVESFAHLKEELLKKYINLENDFEGMNFSKKTTKE